LIVNPASTQTKINKKHETCDLSDIKVKMSDTKQKKRKYFQSTQLGYAVNLVLYGFYTMILQKYGV